MGYSIGIRSRSPASAKKMLAFMKKNFRSWPAVIGNEERGQYAGNPSDDLSYDHAKSAIGFDYGAVSGWEREYTYLVTRWMALKVGRTRSRFDKDAVKPNVFKKPLPYMVYDGYQAWPLIVVQKRKDITAIPKTARWCACDKLGMRVDFASHVSEVLFELPNINITKVLNKAHAEAGPMSKDSAKPEKHWAWVERRHKSLYRQCRKEVDKGLKVLRTEIARLDALWEAQ